MNIFKLLFGAKEVEKVGPPIWNDKLLISEKVFIEPVVEESKKHIRVYLDENIYNFALKMQNMIKEGKVVSSNYTTQDLEKLNDDIATINAQYEENFEFSEVDVKAATRLFLLNNQLVS